MRGLLLVAALGFASPAVAHNVDCDNNASPTEMKSGCCGKEDYRALKPNAVREDGPGYDVFLDGKWRPVTRNLGRDWIIAQPTGAPCWGVWYRQGNRNGSTEQFSSRDGNTEDYNFFCLEQPVSF